MKLHVVEPVELASLHCFLRPARIHSLRPAWLPDQYHVCSMLEAQSTLQLQMKCHLVKEAHRVPRLEREHEYILLDRQDRAGSHEKWHIGKMIRVDKSGRAYMARGGEKTLVAQL